MIGLSLVKSASKSRSRQAVRMLAGGCSFIRSTTLIDADLQLRAGAVRIRSTAASVSSVGTSPQQAMTTSGSPSLVVAGPFPDADAGGAVLDGLVHRQPLRGRLLAGDDDVDVVAAAQAVVGDARAGSWRPAADRRE